MVLSAAICEAYSCFKEEWPSVAPDRDKFIRRLINECARVKYVAPGSLQTAVPRQRLIVKNTKRKMLDTPKTQKKSKKRTISTVYGHIRRKGSHHIIKGIKKGYCLRHM